MKRLFIPFCMLILLTSCFSTEEYFFGTPTDPTDDTNKNIELINDNYQIQSIVIYKDFQEALGVSNTGTLVYDHIKVKADGSLYVMGSKQVDATSAIERFEFQTDADLSNLTSVSSLTSVSDNLKENYFTGSSDDFIFLNYYAENGNYFVEILENGESKGIAQDYFGPNYPAFPTVWHLDANDQLYNLAAESISGVGEGIGQIRKLNTSPSEYWSFSSSSPDNVRYPAFMIGETPYWLLINRSQSTLEIYKGNSSIVLQDASNIQYGYDLIQTTSCDCYFFGFQWVADATNAYVFGVDGNKFGLFKFNSQTNAASLVAQLTADHTKLDIPDANIMVKLLKSGAAFIMVLDGNGPPADGSHDYQLYKVSESESKSYGLINTKDIDSNIEYAYHDFFIINDEPVVWFSSGVDNSDQLLVVTPQ